MNMLPEGVVNIISWDVVDTVNSFMHLWRFGDAPGHQIDYSDTAPQSNLLMKLGQHAISIGGGVAGVGMSLCIDEFERSRFRESTGKETNSLYKCTDEYSEQFYFYSFRKPAPPQIEINYGALQGFCEKLTPPYPLNASLDAFLSTSYINPVWIAGLALSGGGAIVGLIGSACYLKGNSIEIARQQGVDDVKQINSFISTHFDDLLLESGMKMGNTDVYVYLWRGGDLITYEGFNDEGKDQVEWCLLKSGRHKTRTEYYLIQGSTAELLLKNPTTNLPLISGDILRGKAALKIFNSAI